MTPATIPTATRPIYMPDLDELDERTPILAGKLRRLDPRVLADIFNPTKTEGKTK